MTRRRSRYTREEREAALSVYADEGPHAASRATGIPVTTIMSWASRSGVRTYATEITRAANEARSEQFRERRLAFAMALQVKAERLLAQMHEPHVDFKGDSGRRVEYPIAPADAVSAYAKSIDTLLKDVAHLLREPFTYTHTTTVVEGDPQVPAGTVDLRALIDAIRHDERGAALADVLRLELARRSLALGPGDPDEPDRGGDPAL